MGGVEALGRHLHRLMELLGVSEPLLAVEWRDVTVATEALVGSAGVATVGNTIPIMAQRLVGRGLATLIFNFQEASGQVSGPVAMLAVARSGQVLRASRRTVAISPMLASPTPLAIGKVESSVASNSGGADDR